jgi:hypothetical protein
VVLFGMKIGTLGPIRKELWLAPTCITQTNGIHVVLFGMQNRTWVPIRQPLTGSSSTGIRSATEPACLLNKIRPLTVNAPSLFHTHNPKP